MKNEKVNKKLELKKHEIANLNTASMETARGGINDPKSMRESECTCPTGTAPGVCC
jgi:hypothetical protein